MTNMEQRTKDGMRERFDVQFKNSVTGGVMPQHRDGGKRLHDDLLVFIESEISRALLERDKKYKKIFDWLLGIKGDFPDLSRPPHYKFRSELRVMLEKSGLDIISKGK